MFSMPLLLIFWVIVILFHLLMILIDVHSLLMKIQDELESIFVPNKIMKKKFNAK